MKTLLLTDQHWGVRQSSPVFEEHIASLHDKAIDYCLQHGIDHIICLGDFFDVRKHQNTKTVATVKERFFDRLKSENIQFIGIPGNHDSYQKNNIKVNSLSLHFREYDNVTVYTEPTLHRFSDGTSIVLVPWISPDDEQSFMDKVNEHSLHSGVCMGHFEFVGFPYQGSILSTHGQDPKSVASLFDVVLSGHYHTSSNRGNVTYLGTAYDLTWADYGEKKFFHVFDTATQKLEKIENTDRLFVKLFYEESDPSMMSVVGDTDLSNKIVRVVVRERKVASQFDLFMDEVYSQSPFSVEIIDETLGDIAEIKSEVVELLSESTIHIIEKILDESPVDGYNMDAVKEIMRELYTEAGVD